VFSIQGVAPFGSVTANPALFQSGAVRFAANNQTLTAASGLLTLANITFQVIGSSGSTSPLTLDFTRVPGGSSVIVNEQFEAVPDIIFEALTVQVQ
jgi:hypothetical protein